MKIEATCNTCDRTFLLSQIGPESDAPGRCPFCGARFGRHYTTILPEAVQGAERSAAAFVQILGKLQNLETGFDIDIDGLLKEIVAEVHHHDQAQAAL